ncbi:patatin-like phospholipase family protein [Sanyastnella coralliicola]|uniref:patatin-like phospholipase family protein n=1 Tax=Sanyastnella coralliicola TaxID=3069118 RepID=UPI0027BA5CB5|nr:patatin-like phospholipase family protein [Longitalea sp. SCSIO 12813]
MKHLGISGGGTKISGLFGAAEYVMRDRQYQPDIISGISAGAILSLPMALGKYDEIKQLVLNLEFDSFFSESPVSKNGKIRLWNAFSKILNGRYYLGVQKNLEKTLSTVITFEEFEAYKTNDKLPICIVGTVDFYTGKRFYFNLKELTYDQMLKMVNASASLPIFTPGVLLKGPIKDFEGEGSKNDQLLLFDGGVRDHSPSAKVLSSNKYDIKESATIYSRPDDPHDFIDHTSFQPSNLLTILERYVVITNNEISKNDELIEQQVMENKGIKDHGTVFLPRITQGVYDIDQARLKALYQGGIAAAEAVWSRELFV